MVAMNKAAGVVGMMLLTVAGCKSAERTLRGQRADVSRPAPVIVRNNEDPFFSNGTKTPPVPAWRADHADVSATKQESAKAQDLQEQQDFNWPGAVAIGLPALLCALWLLRGKNS